jgi:hypothetical protein
MPRQLATQHLLELLGRICAGGKYLDCITAVHAFGSWSRGAPEVGDIDLNISYDHRLDDEVNAELSQLLVKGRDWDAPFRKVLKPRRALHVMFNRLEMVGEPLLVYNRGDSFETAMSRVGDIAEHSEAGRAAREPVDPVLEPVAAALTRPSLILMTEMARRRYVEIELIDLPDGKVSAISDAEYRRFVQHRWTSTSPLARAATAAGVCLQARGVRLSEVMVLGGRAHSHGDRVTWAVEAREGHLRDFVWDLGSRGVEDWLYVVRPSLRQPLRALHLAPSDVAALGRIADVGAWLADNAPHVARVG